MSEFDIADPTPDPIPEEPDFLEEMIAERTAANPEFPALVEEAVAKRKEVTAAAFVLAWMKNDSLNGVAEAVGLSTQACRARAEKYRKDGLLLPAKVRGKKQEKIDVKSLNELIAEMQVTK